MPRRPREASARQAPPTLRPSATRSYNDKPLAVPASGRANAFQGLSIPGLIMVPSAPEPRALAADSASDSCLPTTRVT
jgi:hypothetical protein